MDRFIAENRKKYGKKDHKECCFCNKDKLLIKKSKYSKIYANKFPYIYGHLLIVPNKHVKELEDLKKLL